MTILDDILAPGEKFEGACRSVNPDIFTDPGRRNVAAAKRVCAVCPIRSVCLETMMKAEAGTYRSARYGIYGGLTPDERAELEERRHPDVAPSKRNPSFRVAKAATA